jgi:type II secretory pathway component PulJ
LTADRLRQPIATTIAACILTAMSMMLRSAVRGIELAQLKANLDARLKNRDACIQDKRTPRRAPRKNDGHRIQLASDVLGVIATAHAYATGMA